VSISASADDVQATTLELNDSFSSEYYLTGTDYYKITLPLDGELKITMMNYSNEKLLYIYDYNLSSELDYAGISSGSDDSAEATTLSNATSKGTYYIKLTNYKSSDENQKYKIKVVFTSYNVTDDGSTASLDSADSLFILSSGTTITGAVTLTDEADWYKITVPSDGTYIFTIKVYSDYKQIYIRNSSFSVVYANNNYGNSNLRGGTESSPVILAQDLSLSSGVYYIQILPSSYYGKYSVSWDKLTPENCAHNYSTTTVFATYFAKGYTLHTCSICGNTYKSDYTAKLKVTSQSIYSLKKGKKKDNRNLLQEQCRRNPNSVFHKQKVSERQQNKNCLD
ncbi:MAG: pre-peptidase C-terminal domain-containing protein, partial [Clostridiales bacterium]|nr:pre-peptidase C-terminal domain-containing protein [Clostridiales bacterium]